MTILMIVSAVVITAAVFVAVIAENYVDKLGTEQDDELEGHWAYNEDYQDRRLALIPVRGHRQDIHGHWH